MISHEALKGGFSIRNTVMLQIRALCQRVSVPDVLPPRSPARKNTKRQEDVVFFVVFLAHVGRTCACTIVPERGYGCTASERERRQHKNRSDPCCRLLIRGRGLRVTAESRLLSVIWQRRETSTPSVEPDPHPSPPRRC